MESASSSASRFVENEFIIAINDCINISLEIEALLLTHPKIKDCGVIGKPDEIAGELPMAFVVRLDSSLSEDDVVNFANENASPAKKLRGGVIFINEIPKNPSGKILRRELREMLKNHSLKSKL